MAGNSTERLGGEYDLGSCFFQTASQQQETTHQPRKHLQMWYYAGFEVSGVCAWSFVLLYSTTVPEISQVVLLPHGRIEWYSIGVASLNLAHSFVIRSECSFRESCPRNLVYSPSYLQWALDLRRVLSFWPHACLSIAALRLNQHKIEFSIPWL